MAPQEYLVYGLVLYLILALYAFYALSVVYEKTPPGHNLIAAIFWPAVIALLTILLMEVQVSDISDEHPSEDYPDNPQH